jgi:hypothetical protein
MPKLKYVVAKVSYGERCGLVKDFLNTKYAILCADDEVYIPSALTQMKANMEKEPELQSVGGLTISIGKYGPITTGNFSYSKMRGYQNIENDPIKRLNHHFDSTAGYRNGAIYRLMRTDLMISTMNIFSQLTNISTPYIFEVTGEIFVNSQGRTIYTDDVYWVRNWINDPVGHRNWDRKLYFKDWATQREYHEQFSRWKRIMADAVGLSNSEFENSLINIIKMRTASENHEINSNLRRNLFLPENLKWLIRTCFMRGSLPNTLEATIKDLEHMGASIDRTGLNQALTALK